MEVIFKRALIAACLFLGACDGAEKRLQCNDPNITAECQDLLKACTANSAAPQTDIAAKQMMACLKRTYAARCNATCQLAE